MHEIVHIVHSLACKKNYPSIDLWEGIAVYLANQYDFKKKKGSGTYFLYGLRIYEYLNNYSKQELLEKLNVSVEKNKSL